MTTRVRNGLEYLSLRTARKKHYCETRHAGCAGAIEPGDRYMVAELPPNSEMGNERWWRIPVCEPCARLGRDDIVAKLFDLAAGEPS